MIITNNFLTELAKAINNESFSIPSYLAISSSITSIAVTDTSLSGETGSRLSLASTRSGVATISYITTKNGTTITSSSGVPIYGVGMLSSSSSGILLAEALIASILQTTTFDVEFDLTVTLTQA